MMVNIPNTNSFCMMECLKAWMYEHENETAYDPWLDGQDLMFFARNDDTNSVRKVSLTTDDVTCLLSRSFYFGHPPKTMSVGRWFCGCEFITSENYDMLLKMINLALNSVREEYEVLCDVADEAKSLRMAH